MALTGERPVRDGRVDGPPGAASGAPLADGITSPPHARRTATTIPAIPTPLPTPPHSVAPLAAPSLTYARSVLDTHLDNWWRPHLVVSAAGRSKRRPYGLMRPTVSFAPSDYSRMWNWHLHVDR